MKNVLGRNNSIDTKLLSKNKKRDCLPSAAVMVSSPAVMVSAPAPGVMPALEEQISLLATFSITYIK
ncbi:MAG: hypothetical protein WA364_25750 [Candidatus Nitrosopolaris sp.]